MVLPSTSNDHGWVLCTDGACTATPRTWVTCAGVSPYGGSRMGHLGRLRAADEPRQGQGRA